MRLSASMDNIPDCVIQLLLDCFFGPRIGILVALVPGVYTYTLGTLVKTLRKVSMNLCSEPC